MKKSLLFLLLLIAISAFGSKVAWGQTTPTDSISQQQIDELKNKIASRVAQLNLVEKRGVLGTVTDASDTQITLTDFEDNKKIIDVDELTKFYSDSDSFGISDIKTGQTLGVLGLYNKESRRILAREVNDIPNIQKITLGVITNVDKDTYEIALTTTNKEKVVFEVETTTKTYESQEGELTKSGFSKIKELQTAIITGDKDKQDPKKMIASRIIILPQVSLAATMNLDNTTNATSSAQ